MTMQAIEPPQVEAPATEAPITEVAPEVPPSTPAEPLTPGEAAKQARENSEARARMQRVKKKSDELFRERQAFAAEQQAFAAERAKEAAAWKEERESYEKRLKEASSGNPLLRANPETADKHLREFIAHGTPEAQVLALKQALEEQKTAFESRFEALHSASQKREEEEQKRIALVQQQSEMTALQSFAVWASSKEQAMRFKHLNAEYTQDEILRQGAEVHRFGKENGKEYTLDEVAAYLEFRAQKVHKDRQDRRQFLFGPSPDPAAPAVTAKPTSASQPANGNGATRRKSETDTMKREREAAEDLAALSKAFKRDAIANQPSKK